MLRVLDKTVKECLEAVWKNNIGLNKFDVDGKTSLIGEALVPYTKDMSVTFHTKKGVVTRPCVLERAYIKDDTTCIKVKKYGSGCRYVTGYITPESLIDDTCGMSVSKFIDGDSNRYEIEIYLKDTYGKEVVITRKITCRNK